MTECDMENSICRICMTEKSYFISVLEAREINGPAMHEMISECTRFKVELYDTLPKKICMVCADDVCTAYRFKKRAEESYKHLCNIYQKDVAHINSSEKFTQTEEHIYSCEHCQFKFYSSSDLQSHRKTEHQGVERRCRFCNKSFELLRQLKSHLIQEHPDQYIATNLQCQICQRKFSRRDHLNRHMRNVHKMDPKSLSIIISGDTKMENPFDSIEVVNEAENEGRNENLAENLTLSDSENEMTKSVHDVNFDAVFCDNTEDGEEHDAWEPKESLEKAAENIVVKVEIPNFDSENGDYKPEEAVYDKLNQYYEKIDDDELQHKELNESRIENVFDRKYLQRISVQQKNTCHICQHIFSRHCHLRRHMQSTHSNIKPHVCIYCEKRFTRSDHLKKHVVNVHEIKAHKCDLCDKAFVKSEVLMRHKELWHNRKNYSNERKVHECEFCNHKFTSKHYLAQHRLMHTDRTFGCRFCERTFKDRTIFREHEREHKRVAAKMAQNNLCY